jgi:hypothetical protein
MTTYGVVYKAEFPDGMVLETAGHTCHVEVTTMTHHAFELHTLVAKTAKKEHPVKFTRSTEAL